jgi:hypothetical protein
MVNSDAFLRETVPSAVAKTVISIGTKKSDVSTRSRRGDGLVGALTSSKSFEFTS